MPGLDLEGISRSVVKLRAEVPEDAFTAAILGSQRTGNGVVINADARVCRANSVQNRTQPKEEHQ